MSDDPTEEVISAAGTDAGVTAVTQRGAIIGLELLLTDEGADDE